MNKQEIIDKLKKLKTLSVDGVGGEKENAKAFLEKMMREYGISENDLCEDKRNAHYFNSKGEAVLLMQVVGKVLNYKEIKGGKIKEIFKGRQGIYSSLWKKEDDYTFLCTESEFIEIKYLFSIYLEDYTKQKDAFLYAYLLQNDLLAPCSCRDEGEPSKEQLEMLRKAEMMSLAIEKMHILKAIENKDEATQNSEL